MTISEYVKARPEVNTAEIVKALNYEPITSDEIVEGLTPSTAKN